jgi:LmbE family N-acetylglucosaminyl deacetylase
MRISTILAHPDDAELWAGGTLLQHSTRGDQIHVLTFADQASGRKAEAEAGARLLGAECQIEDRRLLASSHELTTCVTKFLDTTEPDVVITHWERDTHYEHAAVCRAVCRSVPRVKIDRGFPGILLSCDTYGSLGLDGVFQPTLYIDVSSVFEAKLTALRAHESQGPAWWTEMAKTLGALHGLRSGCAYAEAFLEIAILGQKHSGTLLPNVARHR